MKIALKDVNVSVLSESIEEVVASVIEKMGATDDIEGYSISADIMVKFKVTGAKEPMYLYTDREILGQPEIFTVVPEFNEDGNLVGMIDNEKETFEALAQQLSRELPTEAIESAYNDEDLIFDGVETGGDLKEVVYTHREEGIKVIRYYREGVGLVAELVATPKEGVEQ